MKKTPLYDNHTKLNGKIIDFGGWALPVEYTGIIQEHEIVRSAAGLFDVSHMGEISIKGADSEQFLQKLITNDITSKIDYQVIYSPMCYPNGGVVDDLLIYKYSANDYLLIVNASNTDKDFEWIKQYQTGDVQIENVSSEYAQLAIQGPKSELILQRLTDLELNKMKFYHFCKDVMVVGIKAIVSRTGYTGEDGFELYVSPDKAAELWESLLQAGKDDGLVPVGLGARDSLRFEAALPLYGHEISADITPLEAGLGKFVRFDKSDFIGKDVLEKQNTQGIKRKLVGIEMLEGGIPRSNYDVEVNGEKVGYITTGSYSPYFKKSIAMALIKSEYSNEETIVDVVIRNRRVKAKICKLYNYSKKYKK